MNSCSCQAEKKHTVHVCGTQYELCDACYHAYGEFVKLKIILEDSGEYLRCGCYYRSMDNNTRVNILNCPVHTK